MTDSISKIEDLFLDRLNTRVESPEMDLLESGILDSIALVELLFGLEQEFGVRITIAELDIDSLRSIASIAAMIDGKAKRQVA
jgi:D-alanine--poly(phosphoribitol) ligase subunit 2